MTYEEAKELVHSIEELEQMLEGINKMNSFITPDVLGLEIHEDEAKEASNIFGSLIAKMEGEVEVLKLSFGLDNNIDIKFPITDIRDSEHYILMFKDAAGRTHYINSDGSYDGSSIDRKN